MSGSGFRKASRPCATRCVVLATDLSGRKELDPDPKAIQNTESVGHLKNPNDTIVANESMFVLSVLEKSRKRGSNFIKEV